MVLHVLGSLCDGCVLAVFALREHLIFIFTRNDVDLFMHSTEGDDGSTIDLVAVFLTPSNRVHR